MVEKKIKTEEGYCFDLTLQSDCFYNTLRVYRNRDEDAIDLSHYTCGLPENIGKKTLFWSMILKKEQALALGKGLIDSVKNEQ